MTIATFCNFTYMERRIQELDALRVLAMLFVVTYHFGCEYAAAGIPFFNFFCTTANYDFGNVAVTLFIVLSGGLLYRKYGTVDGVLSNRESLKGFYLKRVKAIYPPFWILSLYIPLSMIRHLLAEDSPFFMGNPFKLLLTVVGFDGYVQMFGIKTYVFCGDWFVGAIVLLYLLFPLLAWCYRKCPLVSLLALAVLYGLQYLIPSEHDDVFSILPVTIALKFCLGFFLVGNLERLRNLRVAVPAIVVFLGLTFVNIPGRLNTDCLGSIAALSLFAVVFYAAPWLLRYRAVSAPVQRLALLSYCVFLVQHVAIIWTRTLFVKIFEWAQWPPSCWSSVVLLALTFAVIFVAAWILKSVADRVVRFIA